ncbi:hypothetical protein PHYC_00169 [Phycisphaerales bacterium]|nr:hypothetical protein PHYC_00169 [Phycisphaerales bacterium]
MAGSGSGKGAEMKKLYVGNLPYSTNDQDLRSLFETKGQVSAAQVAVDRETGRSRGFGFVEMPNDGEATVAIETLNGADFGGRPLVVNEARPKTEGVGRGGGGRGGW